MLQRLEKSHEPSVNKSVIKIRIKARWRSKQTLRFSSCDIFFQLSASFLHELYSFSSGSQILMSDFNRSCDSFKRWFDLFISPLSFPSFLLCVLCFLLHSSFIDPPCCSGWLGCPGSLFNAPVLRQQTLSVFSGVLVPLTGLFNRPVLLSWTLLSDSLTRRRRDGRFMAAISGVCPAAGVTDRRVNKTMSSSRARSRDESKAAVCESHSGNISSWKHLICFSTNEFSPSEFLY